MQLFIFLSIHLLLPLFLHLQTALDSSLFSNLAPFTHLTQVKLLTLNYHTPLALPSKKEKPLATVKRLTLDLFFSPRSSPFDCQLFGETLGVWFPSLGHFTLLTGEYGVPPFRATFGKLPFAVEIHTDKSVDTWAPDF